VEQFAKTVIPHLHDEAVLTSCERSRSMSATARSSSSQLHRVNLVLNVSSARRAGLMTWLSGHLNGVILQTFTKLLVERSTSQLV